MAFRDVDLIQTCLADKRTIVNKLNFYANQVQDPSLRGLIQDMANVQNRHVQVLSQALGRVGVQPGQIAPGQPPFGAPPAPRS